jgi:hypothetical protein
MKKTDNYRLVIMLSILFLSFCMLVDGQPPSPPGGHGLNGNQGPGGPAPVDGGSLILLISGFVYGIGKLIRAVFTRKDEN